MLTRKHRFHGHNAVRKVYRQGKPVRSQLFSLHVNRHDSVRTTKAAIVVSKKVEKSAVRRNRMRRRLFELIRLRLADITPPAELVITVYSPEVARMPADELAKAFDDLFHKAKLN